MKDELFMLCRIKHQECFINVYDCNNMLDVKDVIPLVGILPVDMAACNVSNCLYVLRKETHCRSVLRITRNEEQQFNVFPLITDLSLSLSDVGLFVSVNGSILILSPQIIPNPSAVSVYDARGLLQREIMLSHDKLGFTGIFSVVENSNGNLVLATFCIANGFVTELKEIDTIGRLVHQYKSSISGLSGITVADIYGRIAIMGKRYESEVLDSEFNLLSSAALHIKDLKFRIPIGIHYNRERNEIVYLVLFFLLSSRNDSFRNFASVYDPVICLEGGYDEG